MRRKLLLALALLAAGWNAWATWVDDPPGPAERMARDLVYHASLLQTAAEDDSSCTASLRGLRLPEPDGTSRAPPRWAEVSLYPAYTSPSSVEAGRAYVRYEAGRWATQEIRVERLDLRVERRLTDSAHLATLRFALVRSPPGSEGGDRAHRGGQTLVLETAPTDSGPVVTACYGTYHAADRCREFGGRVVVDSFGVAMERCAFVEGDAGITAGELLERHRGGG